jgi:DNA-binding NtrC family response regulator
VADIEPLIAHFNRLLSTRHQVPMRRFTPAVMEALKAQPWPGNVRELRNLVERLLLTGDIEIDTLDDIFADAGAGAMTGAADAAPASLDEAERRIPQHDLSQDFPVWAGDGRRVAPRIRFGMAD